MTAKTGATSFPFNDYATDHGGMTLGSIYEDMQTGKKFRLVQVATALIGTALGGVGTTILVRCAVSNGNDWIVTDDADVGQIGGSTPVAVGFATSLCPVSTATTTYYCWAQIYGAVETDPLAGPTGGTAAAVVNDGTDLVQGDSLVTTSTDNTLKGITSGTATGVTPFNVLGYSRTTTTGTTTSVFANVIN